MDIYSTDLPISGTSALYIVYGEIILVGVCAISLLGSIQLRTRSCS